MADASIGSAYLQVIPKMDEGALKSSMASAGKAGSQQFGQSFKGGLSSKAVALGNVMSEAMLKGVDVASRAATDVFVSAFNNYADFEQLADGIKTLFGDTANKAMENAQQAFKTAGISANEYMEQVTSFSASLKQSLGGENEWQLANYADQAVRDMADNANKMGSNMRSIQDAYQGFAKQNYTMLDNLKLGYGGTKAEMERLLRDAEKLEGFSEGSLSAENFADIVTAIHAVQEEMGITGTASEEAASTITGSINKMKAAWENWLTGIADENADIDGLTDNLVESITSMVDNALPRVKAIAERIGPAISEAVSKTLHEISPEEGDAFDKLGEGAGKVAEGLEKIAQNAIASGVLEDVGSAFSDLVDIIANSDVSPIFDAIADALRTIKDLKASQELDEAANALRNMGEIPDLLKPESWHNGTQAVVEWDRQVQQAGITAEEYRKLTDADMTAVSKAFETNGYNMESALNSVGFTLDETTGKISKLSETRVDDKEYTVDDGGTIDAQQGKVAALKGENVPDKNYKVSDGGSADKSKKSVNSLITEIGKVNSKSVDVKADVSGLTAVQNLVNMIANVKSKTVDVVTRVFKQGSATGSFAESPYIPENAAGYIATGPTLTNNGWVGEDGAEAVLNWATGGAVIPLTNTRYMRPIASAIADEMDGPASGGDVYNIYLQPRAGASANEMAQEFADAIEVHNRMRGRSVASKRARAS